MSAPVSPVLQIAATPASGRVPAAPRQGRPGPAGRGAPDQAGPAAANLDLRVSDAERAEVADELSRHFGAGRLDEAEFGARLDRVLTATTYRDVGGVLEDLPAGAAQPAPAAAGRPGPGPRQRQRDHGRGLLRIALFLLLVIIALTAARAVAWALAPALWIGALCAIVLLAARARARR